MFPRDMVCLRNIRVDTLHKGDTEDNNNYNNSNKYHIIPACPLLAREQYIKRHDRVCAQLHFNICKETGVKLNMEHWYEHVPKPVKTGQ